MEENELTAEKIAKQWKDYQFPLHEEGTTHNGSGFRKPQLAAICAIKAFFSMDDSEPGLVVMPTGTGKTDVIISSIIFNALTHVLILVPNTALKKQLAKRCRDLGILSRIATSLPLKPIVYEMDTKPSSFNQVIQKSNIIITTYQLASTMFGEIKVSTPVLDCIFMDEAHHTESTNWAQLKSLCYYSNIRCLQLTATPYREDDKYISGRLLYQYSMAQAIEDGYFAPITCESVSVYNPKWEDKEIAKKSLAILKADLQEGLNHVLLVRANTQKKARHLFQTYYCEQVSGYPARLITSDHKEPDKNPDLSQEIKEGRCRILVCVDMFGEGVDFPNLKIAALHDRFSSLPIYLQFIGRITRNNEQKIGTAKFVVNRISKGCTKALQLLYERDANWLKVLPALSEFAIQKRTSLEQLINRFPHENALEKKDFERILNCFKPQATINMYSFDKTKPPSLKEVQHYLEDQGALVKLSKDESVLISFDRRRDFVPFLNGSEFSDTTWKHCIIFLDNNNHFFNVITSQDSSIEKIKKWSSLKESTDLGPEAFYRVFSLLSRRRFVAIGYSRSRPYSPSAYTSCMGAEVNKILTSNDISTARKRLLTCRGNTTFETLAIGVAAKGKVWKLGSDSVDRILAFATSCGKCIRDETIQVEQLIESRCKASLITEVPSNLQVIAGSFCNEDDFSYVEQMKWNFFKDNETYPLVDTNFFDFNTDPQSITFFIIIENLQHSISFKQVFQENGVPVFQALSGGEGIWVKKSERGKAYTLEDFFNTHPIQFTLEDGSTIVGKERTEYPQEDQFAFDTVQVFDWAHTDIHNESLFRGKFIKEDSIQNAVIEYCKGESELIFVDDGAGEMADVVTAGRNEKKELCVSLYHCKFSSEDKPGLRKSDLYEVCGQCTVSVKWSYNRTELFPRLLQRHEEHNNRLIKGTTDDLERYSLEVENNPEALKFRQFIVQPGVSAEKLQSAPNAKECNTLLHTVDSITRDIMQANLTLICSE